MSEPATLPESLRERELRLLSDLKVGENGYIIFVDMQANAHGHCYLGPDAPLRSKLATVIAIERREDGYHVTVGPTMHWKCGEFDTSGWLPVGSITVAEDRWSV
jgi:hypothetical protein